MFVYYAHKMLPLNLDIAPDQCFDTSLFLTGLSSISAVQIMLWKEGVLCWPPKSFSKCCSLLECDF